MSGYDLGPANILLDVWVQENKNISYDENSKWARGAKVDFSLLSRFLDEPFFSQNAPKSTGRELFSKEWLHKKLDGFVTKPRDVQRTLLELSVKTIATEVKKYDIELLLVCGGGAKNEFLLEQLAQKLDSLNVSTTDSFGVNGDFMEAMAFAFFAYKRVHNEPLSLKAITGAKQNGVLGALYASD
jgi:anhydro-N-acetylmuramic acid kinase